MTHRPHRPPPRIEPEPSAVPVGKHPMRTLIEQQREQRAAAVEAPLELRHGLEQVGEHDPVALANGGDLAGQLEPPHALGEGDRVLGPGALDRAGDRLGAAPDDAARARAPAAPTPDRPSGRARPPAAARREPRRGPAEPTTGPTRTRRRREGRRSSAGRRPRSGAARPAPRRARSLPPLCSTPPAGASTVAVTAAASGWSSSSRREALERARVELDQLIEQQDAARLRHARRRRPTRRRGPSLRCSCSSSARSPVAARRAARG